MCLKVLGACRGPHGPSEHVTVLMIKAFTASLLRTEHSALTAAPDIVRYDADVRSVHDVQARQELRSVLTKECQICIPTYIRITLVPIIQLTFRLLLKPPAFSQICSQSS